MMRTGNTCLPSSIDKINLEKVIYQIDFVRFKRDEPLVLDLGHIWSNKGEPTQEVQSH